MIGPEKAPSRSRWGKWRGLPLLIGAAVLAGAVLVGTGLAVAASPTPSPGELTLRIGIVTDPQNLNPFIGYETSTQEIITLNYDYLTDFDPVTLEPRPRLATSWQESNGGKTWVFHLRKGVTWQDGVPVYGKQGANALRSWLSDTGVKNIQALNVILAKGAKPWWNFYGGKQNIEVTGN